jgi:hypothetical protein
MMKKKNEMKKKKNERINKFIDIFNRIYLNIILIKI